MNKLEKAQIIDELADKFKASGYFYIANAEGLSVGQVNDFRRKCFNGNVEYKVFKNTLIEKALEKAEMSSEELTATLKGFSGVLFATEENASVPAKVIKDFRGQDGELPVLKAAYIDSGVYVGDEHVKSLSQLKSKSELIGEVIGLLQSPAKNVISSLQGGGQTLSGLIKTLSERSE